MGEPELEPKNEDTELEGLLRRLRGIMPSGYIDSGIPSVINALKVHGEQMEKLVKPNEELVQSNEKMRASLSTTERLTKALLYLTFALFFIMLLGFVAGSLSVPPMAFWQVLLVVLAVAAFFSLAWVETFGKRRVGAKRAKQDG